VEVGGIFRPFSGSEKSPGMYPARAGTMPGEKEFTQPSDSPTRSFSQNKMFDEIKNIY